LRILGENLYLNTNVKKSAQAVFISLQNLQTYSTEDANRFDLQPKVSARLARKIPSRPGYLGLVRVALRGEQAEPIMIFGAGILISVARADGFVLVPEREGFEERDGGSDAV
jgi:molybdopterin biosynthesis enzyme